MYQVLLFKFRHHLCKGSMLLFTDFSKYLIFLQISELALMNQPKNSLQLLKPTRNTHNTAKRLKIYFTYNKENNIHNIVHELMFQQLFAKEIYFTHNTNILTTQSTNSGWDESAL